MKFRPLKVTTRNILNNVKTKVKTFLLANFTLRKQRNDLFCEVCLSYLNALDKNYFIIVLDENFLHGWKHFGFDTYTTLNLELILQVYMILFSLPNTDFEYLII